MPTSRPALTVSLLAAATLSIAALALAAGATPVATSGPKPGPPADPPIERQKDIYFPPPRPPLREVTGSGFILLTDATKPTPAALGRRLTDVCSHLAALPLRPPPPASRPSTRRTDAPVVVALYARRAAFRKLWDRVAAHYDGRFFGLGDVGGYSYRVFSASFVDPARPGAIPPELSHEFSHVWMWRHAGLPNDGNWLAEGLATSVQWRFHPPAAAERAAWARRVDAGRYIPLKRLLSSRPLPPERYWQAATLAEMLLSHHAARLPAAIEALAAGRSANHIVTKALATDWPTLEKQWTAHVRRAR